MLSGEPTAKGTGLDVSAGKEDPVEFDSSLIRHNDMLGVAQVGGECHCAPNYQQQQKLLAPTNSEIPLPSPSFCSLSDLGKSTDEEPLSPQVPCMNGQPSHVASLLRLNTNGDAGDPGINSPSEASRHGSVGEFGWGGTPVTEQRRSPEATLRWNRNLTQRSRPKVLLMP